VNSQYDTRVFVLLKSKRIGFIVGYLLFSEKLKLRAREAQYHSITHHMILLDFKECIQCAHGNADLCCNNMTTTKSLVCLIVMRVKKNCHLKEVYIV